MSFSKTETETFILNFIIVVAVAFTLCSAHKIMLANVPKNRQAWMELVKIWMQS